uniref:Uncharacterized protein n=1 Tax=Glossina austeni TaxID=7395 RepID=A0A1A9V332_GLOAU
MVKNNDNTTTVRGREYSACCILRAKMIIRCNTNIFTLLKSNYKYKRRCRVLNINTSREMKNSSRSSNNIAEQSKRVYDIKSKISKFLKIFILIMNQLTSNRWTTQILMQIKKIINITNCRQKTIYHKRMQSIRDSDAVVDNIDDDEIINQNNYDKVSAFTSTTSKCQRQAYHSISLSQKYKDIATTIIISITSFLSYTITNHYWMPMIYHYFKYKTTSIASDILYSTSSPSSSCSSTTTSSSITTTHSCQTHDLYVNLAGTVRTGHCINSNIYKNNTWSTLLMLFIALSIGIHGTAGENTSTE